MKALLLARLCAGESYDVQKIMRHASGCDYGVSYIPMSYEYNRIIRNPGVLALSLRTSEMLEKRERRYKLAIMDVPVRDFDAFSRLASMLKERYEDSLEMIVLADHPIKFFNDFCARSDKGWIRKRLRDIFFERGLYRVDRLIDMASRISGKEAHVLASNDALENERAVLDLADIPWTDSLEALPHPQTHAGKDVGRLYFTPRLDELFSLDEWRAISMRFDDVVTRAAPPEDFERLDELVGKHWRYVKRRYPVLEKALDFEAASLPDAAEYDRPDFGKLAEMLPENFADHFGYLRNGFTGLRAKLFNEFRRPEEAGPVPKCTVITFAFNQEKYIGECIESVAAQDAGCAIEHVIFDDASTDRTPEIIRAYAEKYPHIRPVLFRNKPATTIGMAFQSCRSEYVAICDGDDYYTDPLKLRKQIALLDKYPDFSLCFHYTDVFFEDGRESCIYPPPNAFKVKAAYTLRDLLRGNPIQTSSVMYRWRFRNGLPDWFNPFLRPSDWYWHILHAETGPAGFIPEVMSRYRRHSGACYAGAENVDTTRHRRLHGLRELEVYDVLDRHLKHQFHEELSMLASGVFADFFRLLTENGDSSCMDKATSLFPVFARDFLSRIKVVHGKRR